MLLAVATILGSCVSRLEFPPPLKLLGPWTNITANLGGLTSGCGDLLAFGVRPDADVLIAGVVDRGFFSLAAGATNWEPLGQGAGSVSIANDPDGIVFDPTVAGTFWESGIHTGAGLFVTHDGGQTFAGLGSAADNDLVSVDFGDPQRKTLLAGVHESGVHVLLSRDNGMTWTDLGANLPATAGNTSWPLILDANTFLIGSNEGTGSGIFRSEDGGQTWSQVSDSPVSSHPLLASDGTIYWMATNGGVVSSTDQGKSWSAPVGVGVTETIVPGLVELPDGRLASPALLNGQQYLLLSSDKAQTWTPNLAAPLRTLRPRVFCGAQVVLPLAQLLPRHRGQPRAGRRRPRLAIRLRDAVIHLIG